ncbi:MAG TPA: ABC transporter permease [Vicinamibacterales bacterium]|nr:ABC transporter permease [Vicinamibacterales bacterium]
MSWYRLLLRAYPPAFRQRFGQDLEELFADLYRSRAAALSRPRLAVFWCGIAFDTLRGGLAERLNQPRRLPLRVHHARGPSTMSLLLDDVSHAVRALRQQRALSLVILTTVALAIGANSAIFTVVNAVLLRPLPYANPDRVVMVTSVDDRGREAGVSAPDFADWRRELRSFEGLSLVAMQSVNLTGVSEPDRLRGGFVSAEFFEVLGIEPVLGRGFREGEDLPGAEKTAVLTHALWQQRFGGDPGVIGQALLLNNEPHEVIGVLPRSFEFPVDYVNVWLPFTSVPFYADVHDSRVDRHMIVIGRVRDDVTVERAATELRQVAGNLAQAFPDTNAVWSARFQPFHEAAVRQVSRNLRLLAGAVAFVLLIACANIANLLLARASGRQRELAVRAALGASRGRLLRQLLAESVLLALAGGSLGLMLGGALTDAMLTLIPNLPRVDRVAPDGTVVMFTALLSLGTGLAFGLLPALHTSRPDLRASLTEGARGSESRGASRVRSVLVVAELALSLVLLAGAGLFIQSVARLVNVDLGYDPANLLTLEYRLPQNKYAQPQEQMAFHQRVVERLSSVPGVQRAAIARSVPQSGNGSYVGFWKSGDSPPSRETMPRAQFNAVTSDFFRVMGIPLLEGRTCAATDHGDAPLVVIVNRLLAERLWPGEHVVGKRLRSPNTPGDAIVVGVVGNTRPNLLSQPMTLQIYGCLAQQPGIFATVAIKTAGEPLALTRSVQQAIWSVDPDQPMWKIRSAESMIGASVQRDRFVMLLMLCAAGLALLLAALGTYSVLSYTVQRRAREVGVRMALGATRANIARLVLGQTFVLTMVGVTLGVAGALALGRVIATQLYEVSPRDPVTLGVTALMLAGVALVAAWLPAHRATSVDPIITLRAE